MGESQVLERDRLAQRDGAGCALEDGGGTTAPGGRVVGAAGDGSPIGGGGVPGFGAGGVEGQEDGEVPRRVVGDPGEGVVGQVLDCGRGDPDGVVLAGHEVRRRVDGQDPAGDRDLIGVGDGDGRLRPVGQVRERDVAGAPHDAFAEGRHEVRSARHAEGVVRRAEGDDLWRDGVRDVHIRKDHIGRLVSWIQFRSATAFNRWIRFRYEFVFHHEIFPTIDRHDLELICPVDIRAEGHVARVAHGIGIVPLWSNSAVRRNVETTAIGGDG